MSAIRIGAIASACALILLPAGIIVRSELNSLHEQFANTQRELSDTRRELSETKGELSSLKLVFANTEPSTQGMHRQTQTEDECLNSDEVA